MAEYCTTENLRELIKECVKDTINMLYEGITDITYHFCTIKACYNIVKTNSFRLTMASNGGDSYDTKRLFYLSTQRSRSGDIGYAQQGCNVRIQLDGRKLSYNLKGQPLDYWGENGKQSYFTKPDVYGSGWQSAARKHLNFEMEDRIFSYEPVIKNAFSYITRIDIYLDGKDYVNEFEYAYAIWEMLSYGNIQVNVYDDKVQFNNMGPRTINDKLKEMQNNYQSEEGKYLRVRTNSDIHIIRRMKQLYRVILSDIVNILHNGYLRYDKNKNQFIADTLKKYGFEEYISDVVRITNDSYWDPSLESCSNELEKELRKLNTEYPYDNDANRLMKLGAKVIKLNSAKSFSDLTRKYRNGYRPQPIGI